MNATQLAPNTKLFAVRFDIKNDAGIDLYTYCMGHDPAVFRSREDADAHAEYMTLKIDDCEWRDWDEETMSWIGDGNEPEYYVEEITADDMWGSEELSQ